MSVWEAIKGWKTKQGVQYITTRIKDEHTDRTYGDTPATAYQNYVRIWLSNMFLAERREWFKDWHPAVNGSVVLSFGKSDKTEFNKVASPPDNMLAPGSYKNYALTELIPFKGGLVEVSVALLALKGKDYLQPAIAVLGGFAGLVTPPLAQTIEISKKVAEGASKLFDATHGSVHMAMHDTFSKGGNELRPGYIAIVLAQDGENGKKGQLDSKTLRVREDQLFVEQNGKQTPLVEYDHMLLRIETPKERDDWQLGDIEHLMLEAGKFYRKKDEKNGDHYLNIAVEQALNSPDLTKPDRTRVAQAIRDEVQSFRGDGHGAAPGQEAKNLNDVMKNRAISVEEAIAMGPVTRSKLLNGGR